MKLIKNSGNDRVVDALREVLGTESSLDVASPAFSLFAFAEVRSLLEKVARCRLVLPTAQGADLNLLGSEADRPFRNRLQGRWLAHKFLHASFNLANEIWIGLGSLRLPKVCSHGGARSQ
jgi:hypothetical protein